MRVALALLFTACSTLPAERIEFDEHGGSAAGLDDCTCDSDGGRVELACTGKGELVRLGAPVPSVAQQLNINFNTADGLWLAHADSLEASFGDRDVNWIAIEDLEIAWADQEAPAPADKTGSYALSAGALRGGAGHCRLAIFD